MREVMAHKFEGDLKLLWSLVIEWNLTLVGVEADRSSGCVYVAEGEEFHFQRQVDPAGILSGWAYLFMVKVHSAKSDP